MVLGPALDGGYWLIGLRSPILNSSAKSLGWAGRPRIDASAGSILRSEGDGTPAPGRCGHPCGLVCMARPDRGTIPVTIGNGAPEASVPKTYSLFEIASARDNMVLR